MKKFQPFWLGALFLLVSTSLFSQVTFPINDVASPSNGYYAFTNATIVKDAKTTLSKATLVIKNGKIESVGAVAVPKDAVVIDCGGKYIYPSFIDIYSDYGMSAVSPGGGNFRNQC